MPWRRSVSIHALSILSRITDFQERYRQIIESGMQENPVPEGSGAILKRGRKKQSKAKKSPRPLPEIRQGDPLVHV